MFGWLILVGYLVGGFLTWVIAFGMLHDSEYWDEDDLLFSILMLGFVAFCLALFWPLVLAIFGVYRLAMMRVGR